MSLPSPLPQLVMFVVQLGFLATYLSEPIIKAFTNGAALHVLVSQLPSLLGLPLPRRTGSFTIFKVRPARWGQRGVVGRERGQGGGMGLGEGESWEPASRTART